MSWVELIIKTISTDYLRRTIHWTLLRKSFAERTLDCCVRNDEMMRPISSPLWPSWESVGGRKSGAVVSLQTGSRPQIPLLPFICRIWQTRRACFSSKEHLYEINGKYEFHYQTRLRCESSHLAQVCYSLLLRNKRSICYMSWGLSFQQRGAHNHTVKFQAAIKIYVQQYFHAIKH